MNHLSQRKLWVSLSMLLGSVLFLLSGLLTAATTQDVPFQGMTQEQVKNVYGEPLTAKAPVGKPPITRWDYDNYSVYFEGNQVIHAFVHQQRLQTRLNPAAPAQAPQETQTTIETTKVEEIKVEEAQAKIEADMQEVEQVIETKKQKKAELAKSNVKNKETAEAEKDLNYKETPQTDFGKWGY